jgi:seryl-tRNA synthetase/acyl carrier protein
MTIPPLKSLSTPEELERQLLHFINVTLLGGGNAVDRDTRLFEDGYMNSLRILDLIAMVEKSLGARIPDRSVRLANFRTIATIVRVFHPDAVAVAASTPDRLFERRADRSRFASPLALLQQRGDLKVAGAGRVALAGLALEVFEAVDDTVVRWAEALGAPEHRYPSVIDAAVLQRANVVIPSAARDSQVPDREAGPSSGTMKIPRLTARDDNSSRADDVTLSPAVCYHAYPEWAGQTLGGSPTLLTARGHCYRYEDGNYIPLERLSEFTMREIIVIGTRQQVEDVRQSLVRQVTTFVDMLELDASIETATDPFFAAGDEGRRLMQQAGALKYELRLAVDSTGRTIAAASFNHHQDFFGTRFGIRLADDTPAHSGCVAFGLERWVLALLAQHSVERDAWPNAVRAWLDAAVQRRTRGAGA